MHVSVLHTLYAPGLLIATYTCEVGPEEDVTQEATQELLENQNRRRKRQANGPFSVTNSSARVIGEYLIIDMLERIFPYFHSTSRALNSQNSPKKGYSLYSDDQIDSDKYDRCLYFVPKKLGAAYTPVQLILQCSLYSSAAYTPVRLILQCGLYSSVAYTPVWLILQCDLYSSVAYTPVWLILQCGLYSSVAYTPMQLILQCCLYSSVAYTPMQLILQCGLYSSVAYTPVWLILQCSLYSNAAYTPVQHILWKIRYITNVPSDLLSESTTVATMLTVICDVHGGDRHNSLWWLSKYRLQPIGRNRFVCRLPWLWYIRCSLMYRLFDFD